MERMLSTASCCLLVLLFCYLFLYTAKQCSERCGVMTIACCCLLLCCALLLIPVCTDALVGENSMTTMYKRTILLEKCFGRLCFYEALSLVVF